MKKIYPDLKIDRIKNPNRMWAFPLFGGLVKIIILIPVFIELAFLTLFDFFILIINSFYVLFTGQYWRYSYDLNLGIMRLITKTAFFFAGLTDKYPGFNLRIEDKYKLDLDYPKNPNRLFAIPIFGFLARIILLIPYFIYSGLINGGARIGVLVSFASVFVKGRYPESTFELSRDSMRLGLSEMVYMAGLSDKYPSFKVSTNHIKIKIALIILGLIFNTSWSKNDIDQNYDMNDYDFRPSEIQNRFEREKPPLI